MEVQLKRDSEDVGEFFHNRRLSPVLGVTDVLFRHRLDRVAFLDELVDHSAMAFIHSKFAGGVWGA